MKKYPILIFVIVGGLTMYLLMFPRDFSFMPQSKYDIVDKANPKMISLVNQELDLIVSEYGSGMYAYRPEAPGNLKKFYQKLKTITTYSRYGTNSIQGYNGTRADITFQDGRQVKDLYITSGGKFRSTRPKLYMKITFQDGRATEVVTNGLELEQSPVEAKGTINTILDQVIAFDKTENKDNYFLPQPPAPNPAEEWEKVQ